MSDRRYRNLLRSKGLPVALACALAASVGGCSTWHSLGFGSARDSQAACQSDSWPAKVMASVQRAEPQPADYVAEDHSGDVAEYTLDDTPQDTPQDAPPVTPQEMPQSVAPQPAPEHKPPTVEPQPDVAVALPPEPVVPPRPTPSPEVIEVCGATDTACQDQVMAMLADPLHKWIKEKPTSRDERTGVRALAYRVLAPVLACDDLRRGVREITATAAGFDSGGNSQATQPADGSKSLEWVQLLNRAVKLELQAEIAKRC